MNLYIILSGHNKTWRRKLEMGQCPPLLRAWSCLHQQTCLGICCYLDCNLYSQKSRKATHAWIDLKLIFGDQ